MVTSVYLTYIKVAWTAPFANYQQIASYEVQIKDNGTGIFAENKALCDGTNSEVLSTLQCLVPIKDLRLGLSLYDYTLQDLPQFIVRARNVRGVGSFSNPNTSGGLIQTEPISIPVLSRDPLTTEAEIIINWTALSSPGDGYSSIIAYNLQFDKGTNGVTWYDLYGVVPTATLLSFTLTSDIVPGGKYLFRIRAGNVHGFGSFSNAFTIMAAGKPFKANTPTTSIDAATGKLEIQWTAPHDGSDAITSYLIEIADSTTNTWTPDAADCPGTNPAVLRCLIPMSTLTAAPYNYAF